MKNWQHMIMLTIAAIFYTGCSLCTPQIKTVYVEPKPFKFTPIDVNLSEIKMVEKINLDGKLWFSDDSNGSVCMDVDTWLNVRKAKRAESFANKKLGLQKIILKKALDGNLKQMKRYIKLNSR